MLQRKEPCLGQLHSVGTTSFLFFVVPYIDGLLPEHVHMLLLLLGSSHRRNLNFKTCFGLPRKKLTLILFFQSLNWQWLCLQSRFLSTSTLKHLVPFLTRCEAQASLTEGENVTQTDLGPRIAAAAFRIIRLLFHSLQRCFLSVFNRFLSVFNLFPLLRSRNLDSMQCLSIFQVLFDFLGSFPLAAVLDKCLD